MLNMQSRGGLGGAYRSASMNQLHGSGTVNNDSLQPQPALNPWLQPSQEQNLDQIGRIVRAVVLDFFDQRATQLDRMQVQLKGAVEAFNGSRVGRHQTPPIDLRLAQELLVSTVEKRAYVEKTISEAQERMDRTLQYDRQEIVDQMLALAKLDVQKAQRNKSSPRTLDATQLNPLRLKKPMNTEHKRDVLQAGINRTVLHMKNPLATSTDKISRTIAKPKSVRNADVGAKGGAGLLTDKKISKRPPSSRQKSKLSRHDTEEPVELDENMQFLINLGRQDPKHTTMPLIAQGSEQKYKRKIERDDEAKFKLLIKYMAIWKKYVKVQKAKKRRDKILMQQMIKAISINETRIMRKTLFCLKKHSARQQTLRHCQKIVRWNQDRALKSFYFRTMRQKFIRARRRQYLDKVAGSYYQEQRKFKVLKYWHKVVKADLNLSEQAWKNMQQMPFAAELLLEKIAHDFYLARLEGSSISDIVRFHYYALKNFTVNAATKDGSRQSSCRIRPQLVARFSAAVELILRAKQARIFRQLVRTTRATKLFRESRIQRVKRNVWDVLSLRLQHRQKVVFLAYRSKRRLIALVFRQLTGWLRSRVTAKQKHHFLMMRRRKQMLQTYLTEWHGLWSYYSRFTGSTYNYTSGKLSQQKFMQKYFEKLKAYTISRQRHNLNKIRADQKFEEKYVRICFGNWRYFAYQQKKLTYCKAALTKRTVMRVKQDFLSRWIEAKAKAGQAQAFDKRRLLLRAFKSFQARINYLKLKQIIAVIAADKSRTSLQLKGFIALARYSKKKRQLRSLSKVLDLKHQRKLATRSILALQKNVEHRLKKKQKEQLFTDYARANLIKIAFSGLLDYAKRYKELRLKRIAVEEQVQNRRMRSCFGQMYLRYLKRQSDRVIGQRLSKALELNLTQRCFNKWLLKYRDLARSFELVSTRHQFNTIKDSFKLWRSSFSLSRRSRFDLKRFDEKWRMRYLKMFFSNFMDVITEEKTKRENNLAAEWLNSKNLAAKVIKVLADYARRRGLKRTVGMQYQQALKFKCFAILHRRYVNKKNANIFLAQSQGKQISDIFAHWADYTKTSLQLREKELFLRQLNRKKLLTSVFKVLTCPKLHMTSQLEVHELAKLRLGLSSLQQYTAFRRSLKERHDAVHARASLFTVASLFEQWQLNAHYERSVRMIAIPFSSQKQTEKMLQVLLAVKENVAYSKQKKQRLIVGENFRLESLKTRAVEALRWYANEKIHSRNQIDFIRLTHCMALKKTSFSVLKEWTSMQQDLRAKRQVIEVSLAEKTRHRMFKLWLRAVMHKQVLDEDAQQIDKIYQFGLKKKVFKLWYDYRTRKILKEHMVEQASIKWQLSAMRRSFSAIAWYSLVHRRAKSDRAAIAKEWQRRKYLRLWYGALIKAHIHGQEICEVAMTRGSTTGEVGEEHKSSTEQYAPNRNADPAKSVVVSMSTGANDGFQPVFGSGQPCSPTDSVVKIAKSQTQISFGQINRTETKQHGPRISILSDTIRPIESVDETAATHMAHQDLPLQMSDKHESLRRSQGDLSSTVKEPLDDQSAFLESLARLQTSDELRQAHDEMTLRLQSLLKEHQGEQPDEDAVRVSQEYTQLKDIIQLIRSKYEESLAGGGQAAGHSVIEEEQSQETSEDENMTVWNLKLRQKVIAGLKWRVQINREKRETQAQMACKARCLLGLKLMAQQAKAKHDLAIDHFEARQKRIGIYSLKKYQLWRLMERTISQSRQDRITESHFSAWRMLYMTKMDVQAQPNLHKYLSLGNETDEAPQELGFDADPAPFDGFNEDTDEEERKQTANFPDDDESIVADAKDDGSFDSADAREDRIMEFPGPQRSSLKTSSNKNDATVSRDQDEYMASSTHTHDSLDMLQQFVTSAENTTGSGAINKTDTLEAYVMQRFNQDSTNFELAEDASDDENKRHAGADNLDDF